MVTPATAMTRSIYKPTKPTRGYIASTKRGGTTAPELPLDQRVPRSLLYRAVLATGQWGYQDHERLHTAEGELATIQLYQRRTTRRATPFLLRYLIFGASCRAAAASGAAAALLLLLLLLLPLLLPLPVVLAMGFAVEVRLGAIRPELVDRCWEKGCCCLTSP